MTQVCLLGKPDVNLRYELLSRETARQALATYDLREPFENSVAVETVSLGAAVALLNDLNWYLVRFVDDAFVLEPSISEDEWLSRDLATAIRDDEVVDEENGRFLAIYGLVTEGPDGDGPDGKRPGNERPGTEQSDNRQPGSAQSSNGDDRGDAPGPEDGGARDGTASSDGGSDGGDSTRLPKLVEPMLVTRTGDTVPEYDLRDVEDTLVVRLTKSEFGA